MQQADKASRPNRTGVAQSFYLDADLADALQRFMDGQRLAPTKTSVFEAALKLFLEAEGYWPPRPDAHEQP